jgi:hypothetical protein
MKDKIARISSAKKEVIIKKEQFDFKPKINEKSR